MTVKDVFQHLLYNKKISQQEFTSALGYTTRSSVSTPLSRDNGMGMRTESLIRWANVLGYQLVLQPIAHPVEADEYVLDGNPLIEKLSVNKRGRPPKNTAQAKKAAEEPQPSKILLEIPQPEKLAAPPVAERLPNGNWLIHLLPVTEDVPNPTPTGYETTEWDDITNRYSR